VKASCYPDSAETRRAGTELGKPVEAVVFGQKAPQQVVVEEAAMAAQVILDRERKKG